MQEPDYKALAKRLSTAQFAKRVANGEFDATREESDEWANSPSGQEAISHLSPAVAAVMGLPRKRH